MGQVYRAAQLHGHSLGLPDLDHAGFVREVSVVQDDFAGRRLYGEGKRLRQGLLQIIADEGQLDRLAAG